MCNYTDVMNESGIVYGPAVDLCHHVTSCFSFWAKDKPIRLSCSYNYFCFSPFSMPSLSVMLSVSAQAWASIPGDTALECLSQTSARGDWELSQIQYNFPKSRQRISMKSYNIISGLEMVTQVCRPDGLITQPRLFPIIQMPLITSNCTCAQSIDATELVGSCHPSILQLLNQMCSYKVP